MYCILYGGFLNHQFWRLIHSSFCHHGDIRNTPAPPPVGKQSGFCGRAVHGAGFRFLKKRKNNQAERLIVNIPVRKSAGSNPAGISFCSGGMARGRRGLSSGVRGSSVRSALRKLQLRQTCKVLTSRTTSQPQPTARSRPSRLMGP